jgi:hypothetical protein
MKNSNNITKTIIVPIALPIKNLLVSGIALKNLLMISPLNLLCINISLIIYLLPLNIKVMKYIIAAIITIVGPVATPL